MNQETKKPEDKKDNTNTMISIGLLLLLGGVAINVFGKRKKTTNIYTDDALETVEDITGDATPATKPLVLYVTKVLKMGTKGIEVTKLQQLMKINADGFFGAQTEAMLYRLKGVKEVSLDQYAKLPTINRNVLPNGTKVMALLKSGTNIYDAIQKADKTYYSSMKVQKTIPYGKAVGTIRTASADGNWYTVFYNDMWTGDFWTGTAIGFVRASEIEKYQ